MFWAALGSLLTETVVSRASQVADISTNASANIKNLIAFIFVLFLVVNN
jgi:hypothetical protein